MSTKPPANDAPSAPIIGTPEGPPQGLRDPGGTVRDEAGGDLGAGLYVHWPICDTKCGYCDFYSVPGRGVAVEPLVEAVVAELRRRMGGSRPRIRTVFVGGGTPTTLEAGPLRRLLRAIAEATAGESVVEFTVEANPGTVDAAKAAVLRDCGVNRVSMGGQSFHPAELAALERLHSPEHILEAFATLRDAGLGNLNLDLIFGISGQTLASWRESLRRALELEPQHLACYGLTYEPGTALTKQLEQSRVTPCDEGLEAEMLLVAHDMLGAAGFEHYEISNFARPSFRCLHNVIYWLNGEYVGVGPSAAGFVAGRRYKNIANHSEYVRRIESGGDAESESEVVTGSSMAIETLMMRMRLLDGLNWADFERRTGVDLRRAAGAALARLQEQGLIECGTATLLLTRRGLLFADGIIAELSANLDQRPGRPLPIIKTTGKPSVRDRGAPSR